MDLDANASKVMYLYVLQKIMLLKNVVKWVSMLSKKVAVVFLHFSRLVEVETLLIQ